MNKKAVLLVNFGSPDSPSVPDVRRYLHEFLMDGRVIDVPWPIRFALVHGTIVPRRAHASAEAYRSIWGENGSPLIAVSRRVQAMLQARTGTLVELAMRYQNPSIKDAVQKLAKQGTKELLLIPLFPHYAMSSYETAVERVKGMVAAFAPAMRLVVESPFYDAPDYVAALVESAATFLKAPFDHLLFSFHGLPERHLRKADKTGSYCLRVADCCEKPHPAHTQCYRAQCFKTARAFASKAGIADDRYSLAFQSRLGKEPWMPPFTDEELRRLARRGVKRLLVICPGFVTDCLETIEEIGMRGRELFSEAGGETFTLIPCLNNHPAWLQVLGNRVDKFVRASGGPLPAIGHA